MSSISRQRSERRGLSVLQVLPSLVTGGAERGAVDVARAVAEAGGKSLVASSGGPMTAELLRAGVVPVTMPLASKNFLTMRLNARRLARLIRKERIQIVHARSRAPAWSAWWAAQATGAHFLTTFHGVYGLGSKAKRRYNAIMVEGERVIAVSDFIARHIAENYEVDPARIRVIRRGVDTAQFDPAHIGPERMVQLARRWNLPDGVPVIMNPGRITRWKGQSVLLEALSRLKHLKFRCLLVGPDVGHEGYSAELAQQIQRLGLDHKVQMTGDCADMPAAYMLADVVVSASTEPEAFGRVIAEAQAMGRPVIATNHGGAEEQVAGSRTAWLVPAGDPEAMAAAVAEALALEPEQRFLLGRMAMAHIRTHFNKERMCAETLDLYRELLAAEAYAGDEAAA